MTKLKLIVRYVYGFICIISALAFFSSSALTAFLFTITGLFIIPKSHDIILEKLNITLDPLKRYFIALILFTISCFASSKIPDSKEPEKVVAKTEETTKKYLLESVEDLKDNFNDVCESNHIDHHIEEIKVEEGKYKNVFSYLITPYVSILGDVSKENNSLIDVTMLSSANTTESIVDMITIFSCLTSSVDSKLSDEQRRKILNDLGFLEKNKDWTKVSGSTIVNGYKYSVSFTKGMGWFFTITNK